MIVDSMTHEEVYKELDRDRETLTKWWSYQKLSLRRMALKSTSFPLNFWHDYTSPRRIRYMIYTSIFDKRMRHMLTGVIVPYRTEYGWTIYTTWLGYQKLISPTVITPHVLKRYAERCHVDKSGLDLVRHYFERNNINKDSHDQRVVARSVRYNGEEHLSCCVPEGVILGQLYGDLFIARTFITYDMTCGRQKEEFDDRRKEIPSSQELYSKAKNFYATGVAF